MLELAGKYLDSIKESLLVPRSSSVSPEKRGTLYYLERLPSLHFISLIAFNKIKVVGFPGGTVVKNPPANALVQEDSTCRRAAKAVHHNY